MVPLEHRLFLSSISRRSDSFGHNKVSSWGHRYLFTAFVCSAFWSDTDVHAPTHTKRKLSFFSHPAYVCLPSSTTDLRRCAFSTS